MDKRKRELCEMLKKYKYWIKYQRNATVGKSIFNLLFVRALPEF